MDKLLLRAHIASLINFSHQLIAMMDYCGYAYPDGDIPDDEKYTFDKKLEEYKNYLSFMSQDIEENNVSDEELNAFMDKLDQDSEKYKKENTNNDSTT